MKKRMILLLSIVCLLLSGCHVISENNNIFGKSAIPKILPGQGGIVGRVVVDQADTPNPGIPVHLAEVFRNNGEAAYIIDASNSPSSITDEIGQFSFSLIPTGEYVIIIGDLLDKQQIVTNDKEKAQDWIIQPDQITDAGLIQFKSK